LLNILGYPLIYRKNSASKASVFAVIFVSIVLFNSCDRGNPLGTAKPESSFQAIQQIIFDNSCASSGCHSSTSSAGGLVLESGSSYRNLVDIPPSNSFARAAGFVRIKPGKPESSFVFLKIDQAMDVDFGGRMPLNSSTPLPSNYREYIRQWILAGAPREGLVADERLISDPSIGNDTFSPLDPPQQGIQLHLRPFALDPNSEREIFVYDRISNSDSLFVHRVQIKMRPNSHHFILYKYSGTDLPLGKIRDLTPSSLGQEIFRSSREVFVGSQTPEYDFELPANVVLPLTAFQGFDFNSHYINKSQNVSTGEVYINLHTVAKNDSIKVGRPIFDNFLLFVLPRGQRTTITKTWIKNVAQNVFMLSSHTHKRGEVFRIYRVGGPDDGKLIYENYDWDHPPTKTFSPPLRFEAGWGYRVEATYYNETDHDILFGVTSEDEMCIVVGYYFN